MMQVTFVGVGEAIDETQINCSVHVGTASASVLVDCGFSVPNGFFRSVPDAAHVDALYITHFHGDHFFGVPALFLRLWDVGRTKPLHIVGQEGVKETLEAAVELAYPGFTAKLDFPLEHHIISPDEALDLLGMTWRCAETEHSIRDLALRLDAGECSVFVSGDGRPTEATAVLAKGCKLLVHEAYALDGVTKGHGTVQGCIDFARQAEAECLALVHLNKEVRKERRSEVLDLVDAVGDMRVLLPESGDAVALECAS
jgi:ribonuclease BN (tRNA processing enzyme)